MKKVLPAMFVVIIGVVLFNANAQQRIRPEQVRSSADAVTRVFMFQPNGQIVLADLDAATLVLDTSTGRTVLKAVPQTQPAAKPQWVNQVFSVATPQTDFVATYEVDLPSLEVFVNGLAQSDAIDYTVTTVAGRQTVRFGSNWIGTQANAPDVVKLRYMRP